MLTAMRIFNEGVNRWHNIIEKKGVNELFCLLFKIFFQFDGLNSITTDDKKFNFCFANMEEALRKTIKQGIIKTIIYLGK